MFRLLISACAVLIASNVVRGQQIHSNRLRRHRTSDNDNHTFATTSELLLPSVHDEELDFARVLDEYTDMSMSMSMDLRPDDCLPNSVGSFKIEGDGDIGDVLFDYNGGARTCRKESCYRVQDNGDDPPYDPEAGDTLRFAYKTVSRNKFSFQAKVCGIGGDGSDSCDPSTWAATGRCGRIGLNIRESLDPWARNVFVLFEPFAEVAVIYRQTNDKVPFVHDFDGSPDEDNCFWITVERDGDEFTFDHAYARGGSVDDYQSIPRCEKGPSNDSAFFRSVTIEGMPTTVLVGLGVSTPVSNTDDGAEYYRRYTKAKFEHIELW